MYSCKFSIRRRLIGEGSSLKRVKLNQQLRELMSLNPLLWCGEKGVGSGGDEKFVQLIDSSDPEIANSTDRFLDVYTSISHLRLGLCLMYVI